MSNERLKRLMQESLDGNLPPDLIRELADGLDVDIQQYLQYNRLKMVDEMLRNAPYERAPARLALGVMAKIAQAAQAEARTDTDEQGKALTLALGLVILMTMPVLVAAMTLYLNAAGNAEMLNAVIQYIANLMKLVVTMLEMLIQGARTVLADYPQAGLLMVTVLPIVAFWLIRITDGDPHQPPSPSDPS